MEALCPQPDTIQTFGPEIRPNGTTWIYFLNINNQEAIKIGHSTKPMGERAKQHANGLLGEIPVELLVEVRGKVADEGYLHKYFRHLARPGKKEVFQPGEELIDYIRWLRDQHYVSMPTLTKEQRDAKPIRDAAEWLPNPDRRKPFPKEILPGFLGAFGLGEPVTTPDDFYTNEAIISAAREVMGKIDLDPASHPVANRVVQATSFFTVTDNGLTKRWSGRVWLNPPFSQWSEWVPKVLSEWGSGRIPEMCVLAATRTLSAQYFAPLLCGCNAMCITNGRIKFWGGRAGDSPDDGHAIFYFGSKPELFSHAFRSIGSPFYAVKP